MLLSLGPNGLQRAAKWQQKMGGEREITESKQKEEATISLEWCLQIMLGQHGHGEVVGHAVERLSEPRLLDNLENS